ncbi:hypothetical protein GCM10020331_014950 [Ectobacillus funiculus]
MLFFMRMKLEKKIMILNTADIIALGGKHHFLCISSIFDAFEVVPVYRTTFSICYTVGKIYNSSLKSFAAVEKLSEYSIRATTSLFPPIMSFL